MSLLLPPVLPPNNEVGAARTVPGSVKRTVGLRPSSHDMESLLLLPNPASTNYIGSAVPARDAQDVTENSGGIDDGAGDVCGKDLQIETVTIKQKPTNTTAWKSYCIMFSAMWRLPIFNYHRRQVSKSMLK